MLSNMDLETLMEEHGLSQAEAAEVVRRLKSESATWHKQSVLFLWCGWSKHSPPKKTNQTLDQVTPPNHTKKKDGVTPPKTSPKDFVGFFSMAKSGAPKCSLQLCFVFPFP